MGMSYRDLAELYIEQGYTVTPVKNKGPFVKDWQIFKSEEILDKKYNKAFNSCNGIALVTGEKSGVICLDIDILDSNERLADARKQILKALPPIYSGRQGSKKKPASIFYQYEKQFDKRKQYTNIDVEILSGSHACVLPKSQHPNGYEYESIGHSLLDIDPSDLPLISKDVIKLLEELNEKHNEKETTNKKTEFVSESGRCNHGSHDAISALGVALVHKNYPFDKLVGRLLKKDKEINFNSDIKYFNCHTRRWSGKDNKENAAKFVEEIFMNHGPDGKYEINLDKKYESKDMGFYYVAGQNKAGDDILKPHYEDLASYMGERHKLKCDDSLVYSWSGKHYKSISFMSLKNIISKITRKNIGPTVINNFYNMALIKNYYDFSKSTHDPGFLNCNNGLLNINTGELFPHNHNKFFKYVLEHNYDPEADCKTFLKSLNLVTNGDKDLQLLIQMVFGYCIIGGNPIAHKAFMFYGEGGNGKSTILTALSNLVGNENAARVPLTLFDKPFSMISLDGKLVNLIDETPKFNINPEAFKNVVSGGYVRAAHKGKPEVDLKINARVVFACNKLPNFKDDSDGMLRRLIIIPFNHRIPENKADRNIDEKIKNEMPGVLNFAIDGFKMLVDNGYQFHQADATNKALDQYKQETDSVYYFFRKCTDFSDNKNVGIKYQELFDKYKSFCQKEGSYAMGKRSFSRNATKYYKDIYKQHGLEFCENDRQLDGDFKGIKRLHFKSIDVDLEVTKEKEQWYQYN
jgi:P4 family phage/plasmid primase-like protien